MPLYTLRYIANDVQNFALTSTNRFAPSNPKELEAKGELHGLITVIGSEGIQADRVAKFVWDAIVDSYFYSPFTTVIDSLKHSVAVGARKASDLIKNQPELDSKGVNLSFALAVFKGKGAYLTVFGEQQLLLYKNGGFVKVDQIVNQNKGVVLSMAWSDSDLLIMSSPGLIDQITSDKKLGDSADDIAKGIDKLSAYLRG
ncbi:hypothetical protein IT417_03850, partial [bacterium]|nr:hypothetical protein [bacterium]